MATIKHSLGQSPAAPPAEGLTDASGNTNPSWQVYFAKAAQAVADASWNIGDYRDSASPDLGPNWLPCDGRAVDKAKYPALTTILADHAGVAANASQIQLPTIDPLKRDVNFPKAYLTTFIRVL